MYVGPNEIVQTADRLHRMAHVMHLAGANVDAAVLMQLAGVFRKVFTTGWLNISDEQQYLYTEFVRSMCGEYDWRPLPTLEGLGHG